jgi:hypothetical protein
MIWKYALIALAVAGTSFAAGAKFGQWSADAHWNKVRLEDAQQTAAALAVAEARQVAVVGEREQCRAQVAKINEATAQQATKVTQLIVADQSQRQQATRRAEVREQQREARLAAAFTTLDELRRLIDAGAFEGCANERIGSDIVGMLNAALEAE